MARFRLTFVRDGPGHAGGHDDAPGDPTSPHLLGHRLNGQESTWKMTEASETPFVFQPKI